MAKSEKTTLFGRDYLEDDLIKLLQVYYPQASQADLGECTQDTAGTIIKMLGPLKSPQIGTQPNTIKFEMTVKEKSGTAIRFYKPEQPTADLFRIHIFEVQPHKFEDVESGWYFDIVCDDGASNFPWVETGPQVDLKAAELEAQKWLTELQTNADTRQEIA